MKRAIFTLVILSLGCTSSACNLKDLTEPQESSNVRGQVQSTGRIQSRMNHGAFRSIRSAPGRGHGG
jgi:hypothetical protein